MESQSAHSMVCLSLFHRRLAAATPQCGGRGTQGQGHSRSLASEPPGLCHNQCWPQRRLLGPACCQWSVIIWPATMWTVITWPAAMTRPQNQQSWDQQFHHQSYDQPSGPVIVWPGIMWPVIMWPTMEHCSAVCVSEYVNSFLFTAAVNLEEVKGRVFPWLCWRTSLLPVNKRHSSSAYDFNG